MKTVNGSRQLIDWGMIGKIFNRNTVTFKVDTNELLAAADEIQIKISNMENSLERINEKVLLTRNYWEGKVSDNYRNMFETYKEDVAVSLESLSVYVQMLLNIANGYDVTERINVEEAEGLPVDVIS